MGITRWCSLRRRCEGRESGGEGEAGGSHFFLWVKFFGERAREGEGFGLRMGGSDRSHSFEAFGFLASYAIFSLDFLGLDMRLCCCIMTFDALLNLLASLFDPLNVSNSCLALSSCFFQWPRITQACCKGTGKEEEYSVQVKWRRGAKIAFWSS